MIAEISQPVVGITPAGTAGVCGTAGTVGVGTWLTAAAAVVAAYTPPRLEAPAASWVS